MLDQLLRDVRHAVRSLLRTPGFTVTAVLPLALGIGAVAAVFAFANAILIRTLAVTGADRLVIIRQHNAEFDIDNSRIREDVLRRLRREDVGFEDLLGVANEEVLFRDRERVDRLQAEFVTPNYFSMLGVRPAAGRLLSEHDEDTDAAVAVISHTLWTDRFGAGADVIGRRIEIDGMSFEIVGVTEPGFGGLSLTAPRDLQIPAAMMGPLSHGNGLEAVGRLRPGVAGELALARLIVVAKAIQHDLGLRVNDRDDFRFGDGSQGLQSGKDEFRRPVLILGLLVTVVLFIACANLTALLLVRSARHYREAGVRIALGASRLALFRQHFVESLLVAGIAGAVAWAIASLLVGVLSGYVAAQGPNAPVNVRADATVFLISVTVTLATALLFGLWPAWRASRVNPLPAVQGGRWHPVGRPLLARGVVSAEVALSLALLFSAGLFTRTLVNLRSIDLGFRPENLIALHPDVDGTAHAGRAAAPFFQELLRGAEGLPGVRAASLGMFTPLSGSTLGSSLSIPGYASTASPPIALTHYVSGAYFRTMGIPLLEGREFSREPPSDEAQSVIVNQEFARRYFSGRALGRTFSAGRLQHQIIGVVGATKYGSLREEAQPIYYQAIGQMPPRMLLVRTGVSGDDGMLRIRALLQAIDPTVRIKSLTTMEAQIDGILARERLLAFLSTMLGGVAVILSAIGLYGVLAFSVVRRTHEIGVRVAVGASRSRVVAMFLREGILLVGSGLLLGVPLAFVSGRIAQSLIYGLSAQDAFTFVGATGLLLVAAGAAAVIPAWRAARLNAVAALRQGANA